MRELIDLLIVAACPVFRARFGDRSRAQRVLSNRRPQFGPITAWILRSAIEEKAASKLCRFTRGSIKKTTKNEPLLLVFGITTLCTTSIRVCLWTIVYGTFLRGFFNSSRFFFVSLVFFTCNFYSEGSRTKIVTEFKVKDFGNFV